MLARQSTRRLPLASSPSSTPFLTTTTTNTVLRPNSSCPCRSFPGVVVHRLVAALLHFNLSNRLIFAEQLAQSQDKVRTYKKVKHSLDKKIKQEAAVPKIPRPPKVGKAGWSLCRAIGLDPDVPNEKEIYNEIMVSTVWIVVRALTCCSPRPASALS